ncbi:MAG: 2-oxoglutarate oxidoreductase [Lachnospiraceae bacterium]|nr:2-oxoglutarate oxidoreductase [Lachnospiraceae bacterium]
MYDMLCPGCGHRTAMMLIDDIIKQKNIKEKTMLALDVACCSLLIDFVAYDSVMCAHGRVLDVTKGYKTMRKDNVVISYMGDGAAYSIGMEEMVHAARRNDDALVIVINNGLYSMTGGQITPTYIDTQNSNEYKGFLIENLLNGFEISYLARAALTDKENIDNAKKCLDKAFTKYMTTGGFNLVELLSPCPTNYRVTAQKAAEMINDSISKIYKIKEFVS